MNVIIYSIKSGDYFQMHYTQDLTVTAWHLQVIEKKDCFKTYSSTTKTDWCSKDKVILKLFFFRTAQSCFFAHTLILKHIIVYFAIY